VRQAILAAGERVFTRRDYSRVQMDDVAAACGVGKGTLYRYFPSKRALYLAVTFGGIERLRDEIVAAVASADSATRAMEEVVRRTLAFFWDRRGFFALIHRQELWDVLEPDADVRHWFAQRTELTRIVEDTVRRAIAAGDLRPIDPRLATEMLFGMLRAANRYRARTDAFETIVHTVMETFLRGVATPAGQRRLAAVQQRRRA
jgi:TetR/AcrR family fatty acid metabolism transcriptional regulator